jgi:hypothetical protein
MTKNHVGGPCNCDLQVIILQNKLFAMILVGHQNNNYYFCNKVLLRPCLCQGWHYMTKISY